MIDKSKTGWLKLRQNWTESKAYGILFMAFKCKHLNWMILTEDIFLNKKTQTKLLLQYCYHLLRCLFENICPHLDSSLSYPF